MAADFGGQGIVWIGIILRTKGNNFNAVIYLVGNSTQLDHFIDHVFTQSGGNDTNVDVAVRVGMARSMRAKEISL